MKIAWQCLTGKARNWTKLTLTPVFLTAYQNLKGMILLAFPTQKTTWVMEREPYAQILQNNENSLVFIMRKLELVNKL